MEPRGFAILRVDRKRQQRKLKSGQIEGGKESKKCHEKRAFQEGAIFTLGNS